MVSRTAGPVFMVRVFRTMDRTSENPDYGPDGKNKDQSPVRATMVIGRCPSESMSSFNQFT